MKKIVLFVVIYISCIGILFSDETNIKSKFELNFHSSIIGETSIGSTRRINPARIFKYKNGIYFYNRQEQLIGLNNDKVYNFLDFNWTNTDPKLMGNLLQFNKNIIDLNNNEVVFSNEKLINLESILIKQDTILFIKINKSFQDFILYKLDMKTNNIFDVDTFGINTNLYSVPLIKMLDNSICMIYDTVIKKFDYQGKLLSTKFIPVSTEKTNKYLASNTLNTIDNEFLIYRTLDKIVQLNFDNSEVSEYKYSKELFKLDNYFITKNHYITYNESSNCIKIHWFEENIEKELYLSNIQKHTINYCGDENYILESKLENTYLINFKDLTAKQINKFKYAVNDYENQNSDLILESNSNHGFYLHSINSKFEENEIYVTNQTNIKNKLWSKFQPSSTGWMKNNNVCITGDTIIYSAFNTKNFKYNLTFVNKKFEILKEIEVDSYPTFWKIIDNKLYYQLNFSDFVIYDLAKNSKIEIKDSLQIANILKIDNNDLMFLYNKFYSNLDNESGPCKTYYKLFHRDIAQFEGISNFIYKENDEDRDNFTFEKYNTIFDTNDKFVKILSHNSLNSYEITNSVLKLQYKNEILNVFDILGSNSTNGFTAIFDFKDNYVLTMDTNIVVIYNKKTKMFKKIETPHIYNYMTPIIDENINPNIIYNIRYFNNTLYLFSWGGTYFEIKDDILGIDDQKIEEFAEKSANKTIKLIQYDEFQKLISNNEFTIFDMNGKSLNSSESQNSVKNKLLILRNNSEDLMFYVIE